MAANAAHAPALSSTADEPSPLGPGDFYWDDGKMVLTAQYFLRRGTCCGNGCRHCPYPPRYEGYASVVTREPE